MKRRRKPATAKPAAALRSPQGAARDGWAAASARLARTGDDRLVWPEFPNAADKRLQWVERAAPEAMFATSREEISTMPTLSVVAPLYNEEGNVVELLRRLRAAVDGTPGIDGYEIVLIDDGSTDRTVELLHDIAAVDPRLVVVRLSRNFGHQLAATAGLDVARGDAVVLIDADLQDPPELIPAMVERWLAGYDVVYAVRRKRTGESAFKLWTARTFYRVTRRLTKIAIPVDTGDFRLMSRRVIDALKQFRERHRFIRGMVSWVGYKQTAIEYDRDARFSGESKYPFSKMLRFAIDGITSFSDVPLRFASYFGFIVSAIAFVIAVYEICLGIFTGHNLPGYTSTIFAILFLGGVQLIGIGILGEYVGRIYEEIKGRPLYLIADIQRAEAVGEPDRYRAARSAESGSSAPNVTPGIR